MKKILGMVFIFLTMMLVSCSDTTETLQENNEDYIFNYLLPKTSSTPSDLTIKRITSKKTLLNATITPLYFQDNDTPQYQLGMAKSMPEDVTSQYIGEKWNINSGDSKRVWKIDLKDDLYWENGDHITAQDFIDSIVITGECSLPVINAQYYSLYSNRYGIEDIGIRVVDNSLILIFPFSLDSQALCELLVTKQDPLVHEKIYNSSFARNEDGSLIVNENYKYINVYGESPDKYLSYGPYKLVKLDDTGVRLVRNENWFGYKDLDSQYYQTKEIVVEYLEDYTKAYDIFINEKYEYMKLETYLRMCEKNDFSDIDPKYIKQVYNLLFESETIHFDTNYERLFEKKYNYNSNDYSSTIYAIPEFRQALFYSINWSEILQVYNQGIKKGYAIQPFLTDRNEVNRYTGEYFHKTPEFQDLYDQYYNEMTKGHDKQEVIELFNKAYSIAVEKGYLTESEKIVINGINSYSIKDPGNAIFNTWKEILQETVMADKIEFGGLYHSYYDQFIGGNKADIYMGTHDNYNYQEYGLTINNALNVKEQLGISDFRNEEFSIEFDKVVDQNGKIYNNVVLSSSIGNWIDGFDDEAVITNIVVNGVKQEQLVLFYKDNAKITNKILAECEIYIHNDYSLLPTVDYYNPRAYNDNINLNYDTEVHNILDDFRFITYN